MKQLALLLTFSGGLLATGCAALPEDIGPEAAASIATSRVPSNMRYYGGKAPSDEVTARVKELLQQPLHPEAVSELTLLLNRRVQAALARAGVEQSMITRARTQANPTLSAEWLLPVSSGEKGVVGAGIASNLVDLIFMGSRVEAATHNARAATHEAAASVLWHAMAARRAFVDASAMAEVARLSGEELDISTAAWKVAQELHRAGNITDASLVKAEIREQEDRLAAAAALAAAEASRETLARAIGLSGTDAASMSQLVLPAIPDTSALDAQASGRMAVDRSLALTAQQDRIKALLARQPEADVGTWLFGLRAGVEAEHNPQGHNEIGPTLGVTLPIFGRDDSASVALSAQIVEASESYLASALELRSVVREKLPMLQSSLARHQLAAGPGISSAQRGLSEATLLHNAMQIGVFELLESRRGVTLAMRREVLARLEAWHAWLDVYALATGTPPGEAVAIAPSVAESSGGSSASAGH